MEKMTISRRVAIEILNNNCIFPEISNRSKSATEFFLARALVMLNGVNTEEKIRYKCHR